MVFRANGKNDVQQVVLLTWELYVVFQVSRNPYVLA